MALPPAHDTSFPGGSLPTPRTPPVRRPQGRPSSTKWAELKPIIHQLYITEDKTLKEVAEVMRMAYAFAPTERSFKRWIAAWGWRKNIHLSHATDDDNAVHAALQIRGRRAVNHHDDGEASSSTAQLQHQKRYVRLANGHCVDAERLAEYIRRRRARLLSTSAHSQEGHHPEQATAPAARLSPSVRAPDNLRACEAILLQTRRYTHGRHGDQDAVVVGKLDTRAKARLLLQYRDCSVRWLSFVGGVKAALASSSRSSGSSSSSTALLAARMQRAPERLAAMIALQPYSILPSLFMFILQTSAGGDSGDDDGDGDAARLQLHVPREDRAQLAAVVRALLRYGVTVAMDLGMPRVHPLPQLLAALPMVEEGDLGEVVRRSFGWTSKWWGGVSLEGILDAEIAGICSRNWVRGGEKGDIITYTQDVLNQCQIRCEAQYGLGDERTMRTLLAKAEINEVIVTEKGLDCYQDSEVVRLYQAVLDRAAVNGPARSTALRFFKDRSEAAGVEWKGSVPDSVGAHASDVPSVVAHLYMHLLAGAGGTKLPD